MKISESCILSIQFYAGSNSVLAILWLSLNPDPWKHTQGLLTYLFSWKDRKSGRNTERIRGGRTMPYPIRKSWLSTNIVPFCIVSEWTSTLNTHLCMLQRVPRLFIARICRFTQLVYIYIYIYTHIYCAWKLTLTPTYTWTHATPTWIQQLTSILYSPHITSVQYCGGCSVHWRLFSTSGG